MSAPGSARLVLTLGAAGMAAGLAIAGVYQLTLPRIQANKARELRAAVFRVLPGSTRLQGFAWREGRLEASDEEAGIYAGYDDSGAFRGWAIPAKGPGFQDTIELIYGYRPDTRRITGMKVLESRETPGLGDRIVKDPDFAAEFADLAVDPEIVPVKHGTGSRPNEVDCITGATISSKSVVRVVNASDRTWLDRLPEPGAEPPAGAATEDR